MKLPLLTEDEIASCCPTRDRDEPYGFGALQTPQGNLPLKLMDVEVELTGLLAHTRLRQTFVNTLGVPLEATYIFPLPDRAAVGRFQLEVGERTVEGVLKERGQARREYQQAVDAGHRAAIAEEDRSGVFTLRVGNILPGEEATVHLTLDGPVHYQDGEATFRFPLVVAPRYIPGAVRGGPAAGSGTALDTDSVPDASRITPPVLLPGVPNPVRLSLRVDLDPAGLPLGEVRSSLHATRRTAQGARQTITLHPGERLNRDFVLRYGIAADERGSSLSFHPDSEGEGTFQLTFVPSRAHAQVATPRDVVFLLDRSGSMEGWKMVAARRATARMIDSLTAHDRFAVLGFDHTVVQPPQQPGLVAGSDRNRYRAVEWLGKLDAAGGTELAQPLTRALALLGGDPTRDRVVVLVTDGQVGNEDQILRTLAPHLSGLRVFSLGIDRAVNAGFLRRLAGISGGYCELVESEDRLDEVMDKVHRRIGTPLLTELSLEGGRGLELELDATVPARLPDLFAGSPITILGRYRGAPGEVTVRGVDAYGGAVAQRLRGVRSESPAAHKVWARGRVRDLEDRYVTTSNRALVGEITALSLRHGVLCRFTSFVAVDHAEVANPGGQVHKVTQAVEQPSGWLKAEEPEEDGGIMLSKSSAFSSFSAASAYPAASLASMEELDDLDEELDGFSSSMSAPGAGAMPPAAAPSAFAAPRHDPFDSTDPFADAGGGGFGAPPPQAPGLGGSADPFAAPQGDPFPARGSNAPSGAPRYRSAPRPAKRRPAPAAPVGGEFDLLSAYRRRGRDLIVLLDRAKDAASDLRQRELGKLAVLLATLVEDLTSVGGDAAAFAELVALRDALRAAQRQPLAPAELDALERRARQVLQAFVDSTPAAPAAPAQREGFWF